MLLNDCVHNIWRLGDWMWTKLVPLILDWIWSSFGTRGSKVKFKSSHSLGHSKPNAGDISVLQNRFLFFLKFSVIGSTWCVLIGPLFGNSLTIDYFSSSFLWLVSPPEGFIQPIIPRKWSIFPKFTGRFHEKHRLATVKLFSLLLRSSLLKSHVHNNYILLFWYFHMKI